MSERDTNRAYVKRIIVIIILTNLGVLPTLWLNYRIAAGWMLGSLASAVNFLFMARGVLNSLNPAQPKASSLAASKSFFIRYFSLIAYAVIVAIWVKPDLLMLGLGLVAAQLAIYIEFAWNLLAQGKLVKFLRRIYGTKKA